MRWITWLFVVLMGFLTIGMVSAGFAIPAIIAIASVALVLPPLWDHIKATSSNTRPILRGSFAVLLAFSALGSWGSHYADTPEGKAALQAQAKRERADAARENLVDTRNGDDALTTAIRGQQWQKVRDGILVTRIGFEARDLDWPLAVNSGIVGCTKPELLWLEVDGERYALNGMAKAHLSYEPFDVLWKYNPDIPEMAGATRPKVSASDLLMEARKACE